MGSHGHAGQLSVGEGHVCWVDQQDKAWCWGNNEQGQLGDGTQEHRALPTAVLGVERATAVVAGGAASCAILPEGELLCWGMVHGGKSVSVPTKLPGFSKVRSVALGARHVCAIVEDGRVRCIGSNNQGQLGAGHTASVLDSVLVPGLAGAKEVAVGPAGSCALRADGEVLCWGADRARKTPALAPTAIRGLPPMASIVSNGSAFCGLGEAGVPYCWGSSEHSADEARQEVGWPELRSWAMGASHRCGLTRNHELWCSGIPLAGEMGELPATATPREMKAFGALKSGSVLHAGGRQTCVVEARGVRCVGANDRGQLGIGESGWIADPREIRGLSGVRSVMPFGSATCALLDSGRVSCWGLGSSDRLELSGEAVRTDAGVPHVLEGISDATHLLRGPAEGMACITRSSGELICFQAGLFKYPAQLSSKGQDFLPTRIQGIKNVVWTGKPAGGKLVYAVLASGDVVKLSIDPSSRRADPSGLLVADAKTTPILGVTGVTRVAVQDRFVCGLKQDQTVICWKEDPAATGAVRSFPIAGLGRVTDLTGWNGFYALSTTGALSRWTIQQASEPFQGFTASATGLTDVKLLGHGTMLCLVRSGGGMDCDRDRMGHSSGGRLDNPAPSHFEVGGVRAAESYGHTCAVRADQRVLCWGLNRAQALGVNERDRSAQAVSVLLPTRR